MAALWQPSLQSCGSLMAAFMTAFMAEEDHATACTSAGGGEGRVFAPRAHTYSMHAELMSFPSPTASASALSHLNFLPLTPCRASSACREQQSSRIAPNDPLAHSLSAEGKQHSQPQQVTAAVLHFIRRPSALQHRCPAWRRR